MRISTVTKKSVITAHSASIIIDAVDEEIDKEDQELKLILAEHFQPELKHTICMIEILQAEKIN